MSAQLSSVQEQGSPEWLALRKKKITATDANVIMGANPWKTKLQLYKEKLSDEQPKPPNERMIRGTQLEPVARELFYAKTGHRMEPKVVVKDWAMASLDGINAWNEILEIKCPGERDHAIAVAGNVPDHYYPQLQHQMYVCDSEKAFYFSFDGFDGVIVTVRRNNAYIEKMIAEEFKFYECLQKKIQPEGSYVERDDILWEQYALKWKSLNQSLKELEKEELQLREQLIFLSGESNTKGSGISLCQVERKGNVDYTRMLKQLAVDDAFIEKYRKPSTMSWRLTSQ